MVVSGPAVSLLLLPSGQRVGTVTRHRIWGLSPQQSLSGPLAGERVCGRNTPRYKFHKRRLGQYILIACMWDISGECQREGCQSGEQLYSLVSPRRGQVGIGAVPRFLCCDTLSQSCQGSHGFRKRLKASD